ncbi:hypothetical protein ABI59_04530 [Acidobacteria bacterium Mor1]|nr:hypothetical protein ABI59_04530 [Acidobacteria bacterium Mor1]
MWLNRLTVWTAPLLRLYWRPTIVGAFDRIPSEGPLLVAPNHASFLDPWWLSMIFPRGLHYLITDTWYYKSRGWRFFFDANGTLPVSAADPRQTIADVCGYLSEGKVVGVFPEGGISDDGKIRRFRPGLAHIAARSGVPVVPVGLRGNYDLLPRTQKFPRPGRLGFHIGEPMVFPGSPHPDRVPRRALADFNQELFERVCTLAGQEDAIERARKRPRKARRDAGATGEGEAVERGAGTNDSAGEP